jgi:hypothetical protein
MRGMRGYGATYRRCAKHVRFEANPAGKPIVAAYDWLREHLQGPKPAQGAPQEVITTG